MKPGPNLIKAVGVTLEITGTTLSDGAVKAMLADLVAYPEPQVLGALRRCCRELKGKLTLADILQRIEDGRPTPEEAWAACPKDEAASAYWTSEMREAFAAAWTQVEAGDLVPARMTFLERYRVLVQQARDARQPVVWEFTPGTDKAARELVVLDAVAKGRLSQEGAEKLLPYHRAEPELEGRLLQAAGAAAPKLPAPRSDERADAWKRLGHTLKSRVA